MNLDSSFTQVPLSGAEVTDNPFAKELKTSTNSDISTSTQPEVHEQHFDEVQQQEQHHDQDSMLVGSVMIESNREKATFEKRTDFTEARDEEQQFKRQAPNRRVNWIDRFKTSLDRFLTLFYNSILNMA